MTWVPSDASSEELAAHTEAITALMGSVSPFDSRSHADTPESILFARADLVDAFDGASITISEQKTLNWLLDWDQPTLHNLAAMIRKARAAGPVPS